MLLVCVLLLNALDDHAVGYRRHTNVTAADKLKKPRVVGLLNCEVIAYKSLKIPVYLIMVAVSYYVVTTQ